MKAQATIVTVIDTLVEARDLLTCVTVLREHYENAIADDSEGKLTMAIKRALEPADQIYASERRAAA